MKKQNIIKTSHLKGQEIFVGLEDSKKSWKICVRSQGVVVNEMFRFRKTLQIQPFNKRVNSHNY